MYSPPSGNVTNIAGIFNWISGTTNNLLFPGIVTAIFFIILVKLLYTTDNTGRAFAGASFSCIIFSVLLRTANLVNNRFMIIFIILTGISAVWMHVENAKD